MEGWGACWQAGQGVAGIGEAGVEACGEATALQYPVRAALRATDDIGAASHRYVAVEG